MKLFSYCKKCVEIIKLYNIFVKFVILGVARWAEIILRDEHLKEGLIYIELFLYCICMSYILNTLCDLL